tara:strand:- start:531 stop:713 length:183 start_codon:yes stop_codon:yes gene_type:complete
MHLKLQERAQKLLQERQTVINRLSEINGALTELDSLAQSLGEEHEEKHEEIESENLTNED